MHAYLEAKVRVIEVSVVNNGGIEHLETNKTQYMYICVQIYGPYFNRCKCDEQ